jgi:SAM-dependent methyltransferase
MTRDGSELNTIDDFGQQWTRFPRMTGYLTTQECLADHFGELLSIEEFRGKYVADIGGAIGRIASMLLEAGARRVAVIEPSDAFFVLERALVAERGRVELIHDVGEAVGRLKDLDFVLAFGVLQFIIDPNPIVRAAYTALRPGGKIAIWLYSHEGNETYLRVFGTLRRITVRLPDPVLAGLASFLAFTSVPYIALCRLVPLPLRGYMLNHFAKLDHRMRQLTVFDQLNPRYAKYHRQAEARALVADAGFGDVRLYHRHGYSWTVMGTKPGG